MAKFLFTLIVFMDACVSSDPIENAEAAYGQVSELCDEYLRDVEILRLNQTDLQQVCSGTSIPIDGCSFGSSQQIYALNRTNDSVLEHEYLHILLYCETGNSDPDHTDPAWKRMSRAR